MQTIHALTVLCIVMEVLVVINPHEQQAERVEMIQLPRVEGIVRTSTLQKA